MPVQQEEYSRWYIVQALFKLMNEYSYEKINVTDIVARREWAGRRSIATSKIKRT